MGKRWWNELSESAKNTVRDLDVRLTRVFRGFDVPRSVVDSIHKEPAEHDEIIAITDVLGFRGWESVDRDVVMSSINSGVAVINLCDGRLFPYFVPLFVSLCLREAFYDEQDEMFVESVIYRTTKELRKQSQREIFSAEQRQVVAQCLSFLTKAKGSGFHSGEQ